MTYYNGWKLFQTNLKLEGSDRLNKNRINTITGMSPSSFSPGENVKDIRGVWYERDDSAIKATGTQGNSFAALTRELNTRKEKSHLRAPVYYSLLLSCMTIAVKTFAQSLSGTSIIVYRYRWMCQQSLRQWRYVCGSSEPLYLHLSPRIYWRSLRLR